MIRTFLHIIFWSFVLFASSAFSQNVKNPRTLPDEWEIYGVGDPYILKYKGKYWLYASTRDDLTGVKVWSSWDLVQWNYEGLCTNDPITIGAYAPEVIYYNGTFYMYTSPGGRGHYILSSDSPTGPFVVRTGNLGLTIDGNVFIDDDGALYFTYAGNPSILGRTMSSPLLIDGPQRSLNASLNEWTEGSTIFKRNGLYYMTYTGNHVISRGYRIVYGTATSPLGPYTPSNQGPIVLNTEGDFYGLGHSGTVQGPDLDTWYIAYHNKYGDMGKGPIRALNIDPHGFNGDKLLVYGPCNWTQPAPALPAFYDRFDRNAIGENWTSHGGGSWGIYNRELMWQDQTGTAGWFSQVSKAVSAPDYTAEFNMKEMSRGGDNARFGALFSYRDERNYGRAVFSSFENRLYVELIAGGAVQLSRSFELLPGWDYQKWHALRIEKNGSRLNVFVDGMMKFSEEADGLAGGSIGLTTFNDHADFGYTAFSNHINGSGIFDFYKPVPGTIEAVHFNGGGEGVGYHDLSEGNTGGAYRNENADIRACPEGGYNIGWNRAGEWYKYNINVKRAGPYHLGLRYTTVFEKTRVRFLCDNIPVTEPVELPVTEGWNDWQTFILHDVNLPAGYHTLTLETVAGEFDFYTIELAEAEPFQARADNFNSGFSPQWNYSDGGWNTSGGVASLNGWGKRAIGNTGWSDYSVEADIQCPATGNAGIIFRVKNPANGLADNDPRLGTDFYQGYYAGIQAGGIQLGKQNYDWQGLAFNERSLTPGQWYRLRVVANGGHIKVYLGDMENPVIDYFDKKPFISGKAGLRVFNAQVSFDNFQILQTDCEGNIAGTAYRDRCGVCVGGNTGKIADESCKDCHEEVHGTAFVDACGECAGGSTGLIPVTDPEQCVITGTEMLSEAGLPEVYPNPFSDHLNIKTSENQTIRLYDIQGTILFESKDESATFSTAHLPPGFYIMTVTTPAYVRTVRLEKLIR